MNGVNGSASLSPASAFFVGSYGVDREALKKLGIGLAIAAALLAFIVEKLY